MRLRLTRLGVLLLSWLVPVSGGAEDRVIFRGNYYRERSTRILQPSVLVTVDAPDQRLTVGAGYLLDAITSASIAAGTMEVTGGDSAFTEIRHEALGTMGSRLGEWRLGGFFRYSTETDYLARSTGASVARDFMQRTVTLSLNYAHNFNRAFMLRGAMKNPWCGGIRADRAAQGLGPPCLTGEVANRNLVRQHYIFAGYSHVLRPTLLAQASVEASFARGPQDNPYRGSVNLNGLHDAHPLARDRLALTGGLRWMVPAARMVVDPDYRFYGDDWGIQAHAADLRLHFRLARHVRARVRYRFYAQTEARFFHDDQTRYTGEPGETRSGDPKMDDFMSHTPGIQLTYHLDDLARRPGLGWLEGAWIQATYNHLIYDFDDTRSVYCASGGYLPKGVLNRQPDLCAARVGSLAFSLTW